MRNLSPYAALLALLFVFLSLRVIRLRRRLGIGLGHADQPSLLRAVRVQANFAEYVPLALLLILLVELSGVRPMVVHLLGATLLVGRLSHAYGVSREREVFAFRVAGMGATLTVVLVSAALLLGVALAR